MFISKKQGNNGTFALLSLLSTMRSSGADGDSSKNGFATPTICQTDGGNPRTTQYLNTFEVFAHPDYDKPLFFSYMVDTPNKITKELLFTGYDHISCDARAFDCYCCLGGFAANKQDLKAGLLRFEAP